MRPSSPTPPHAAVINALDKLSLYRTARDVGIAVPGFSPQPPAAGDTLRWVAKQRIYGQGAIHKCYDVQSMPADIEGELVYQERVGGTLAAVVAFRDHQGHLRYMGGQLAQRVFPEPHGVSVRANIVDVPAVTAEGVERLLDRLGWCGIAEVQFLVPPRGNWQLIDFNGRYFGSMALTAAVGADLPNAWLAMATGSSFTLPQHPQRKASYQWLEGDLRRALQRRRGKLREVGDALRFAAGADLSLWQRDDPAPFIRQAARIFRSAVRKTASL